MEIERLSTALEEIKIKGKQEVNCDNSVTGYTPTILKYNNTVFIDTFSNISIKWGNEKWIHYHDLGLNKESCVLKNIEVWTNRGWTTIQRIIRYKLGSHNKIIRILTHTGCIDVTDDHALFLEESLNKVVSKDLFIGNKILHNPLYDDDILPTNLTFNEQELNLLGFYYIRGDIVNGMFLLDGKKKYIKNCGKYSVEYSLFKKYYQYITEMFPDIKINILRKDITSENEKLIKFFKDNFYDYTGKKIIPVWYDNNIKDHFIKGITDACVKNYKISDIHLKIRNNNQSWIPTIDEARIMGYFMGDGSCGAWINSQSGCKMYIWALISSTDEFLLKYKVLCEKVFKDLEWKIHNREHETSALRLYPTLADSYWGAIRDLTNHYRSMFYDEKKNKIVPTCIINSSREIQQSFWDGLYDADGYKRSDRRIGQKSQIACAGIFYLATRLNYKVSVNDCDKDKNFYTIGAVDIKLHRAATAIKKKYEIPYDDYVYDLITDNSNYSAGIGCIVASSKQ